MTEQHTSDNDNTPEYEKIVIVHSSNLRVYEQHSFFADTRTFVLICSKGTGYVAIGAKVRDWGYVTLRRWSIEYPGGFSFSIPATGTFHLKCVSADLLLKRYQNVQTPWEAISRHTRSHAVLPVTRGHTRS